MLHSLCSYTMFMLKTCVLLDVTYLVVRVQMHLKCTYSLVMEFIIRMCPGLDQFNLVCNMQALR